jgi:hypothetical protein
MVSNPQNESKTKRKAHIIKKPTAPAMSSARVCMVGLLGRSARFNVIFTIGFSAFKYWQYHAKAIRHDNVRIVER